MWAGSRIDFVRPLAVGSAITRHSRIADVSGKEGRSGPLVFVRVRHEISDADGICVVDEHDIVYRENPKPGDPVPAAQLAPADPANLAAPEPRLTQAAMLKKARAPKPAKHAEPQAAPVDAQAQWDKQQNEYQLARTAYDANERAEGYRWARQNKVRTPRYCRALEQQRNTAFMQGCLNYASQKSSATGAPAPADPG